MTSQSHVEMCTVEMSRRFVKNPKPTLYEIFNDIILIFNEDPNEVKSKSRKEHLVLCRKIFAYVTKSIYGKTICWHQIANYVGSKHHTTPISAFKTVKVFIEIKDHKFMINWGKYIRNSTIWQQYNKQIA